MRPFDGRRVLLVISGGIAAYKSAYLTRRLLESGAVVDVVLTHGAQRFVGKTTFEGLTGRPVFTDLWESPMAHLDLGREADVAVVAPATADFLSRLAHGSAGDLASATLLASSSPLVVCPAMNSRMWEHPATVRNMEISASSAFTEWVRRTVSWPKANRDGVAWRSPRRSSQR